MESVEYVKFSRYLNIIWFWAHGETAGIAAYQKAERYKVKRTGTENDISGSVNTAKLTAAAQVVEKGS